jgi:carbon storage regulator
MLILTREAEEGLTIGDNIRVVVVSVIKGKVRLGIEAPKELPIIRDNAIKKESKE